jgi:hypothetical protein
MVRVEPGVHTLLVHVKGQLLGKSICIGVKGLFRLVAQGSDSVVS